jgi:hypothetical protein
MKVRPQEERSPASTPFRDELLATTPTALQPPVYHPPIIPITFQYDHDTKVSQADEDKDESDDDDYKVLFSQRK